MSANPEVIKTGITQWENRHQTFIQPVENIYDLWNADSDDVIANYNAMTKSIQQIIAECVTQNLSLRALGGGWSWTKIATTNGRMLNTKGMNIRFSISAASVSTSYRGQSQNLLFAQCGNSVQELNRYLKKKNRSLKTSGASNGQTIVGALSTGTHGSTFDFGAIPEFVVGLHIITGANTHVWLEKKSYPVVSESLVKKLNAGLIQDDDLFNAALVSFGSFGFIHGVMMETENIYLLETHRVRMPMDSKFFRLIESLDFTNANLPRGSERPFHFQTLINPYDKDNGAYVSVMYKRTHHADYKPPVLNSAGIGVGDDAPAFIGLLSDAAPAVVPSVVNKLIGASYKPYSNIYGTLGEIFSNTDTRGKILSAAIGIPLNMVNRVREILLTQNDVHKFAGVFAFRYVKASKATLSFTRFSPVTCVVEVDGILTQKSIIFCHETWKQLDQNKIPYTFHWGKMLELNPVRIKALYGKSIDLWKTARSKLLKPEVIKVFTNPQLTEWGLN